MNITNHIFIAIFVFLAQFFLVDFLSIKMIRPDFLVIYIFYFSLLYGRTLGIIAAFSLGLLSDLSGVGSFFGLAPLALTINAYLVGFLKGKYERLFPYVFHLLWLIILLLHFFIITYVNHQLIFVTSFFDFIIRWLMTFGYTMMFFLVIQFFFPVKEASIA